MKVVDAAVRAPSTWAPLAVSAFRWIWIATIVSNIGSAMQVVGATWVMVKLDNRPLMLALLQAAGTLPMFVAGLPAGVLADIVDRRRLLIAANLWMVLAAFALFGAGNLHQITVPMLLGLTFALGLGAAVNAPAFQAIVPELAPGALLMPAVSLNSAGTNVAKTIGPALGGVVVGLAGIPWVFALNALSTVAVLIALVTWRRKPTPRRLPPEHFFSALRSGLRYVSVVPQARTILWRSLLYFSVASALWALLPSIASKRLHLDALGYGGLLGALGSGAVLAALLLPLMRQRWHPDRLAICATGVCGAAAVVVSLSLSVPVVMLGTAAFGAGWVINLTLLNVSIQLAVEGWIKARMLSFFVVAYMGSMTLGSVVWGYIGQWTSPWEAMLAAGLVQLASATAVIYLPLDRVGETNLMPASGHDLPLLLAHGDDQGIVLITVDYEVPAENLGTFYAVLAQVKRTRLRTGAISWHHWSTEDNIRQRESYIIESWTEYMRQQLRRTREDENLDQAMSDLLAPDAIPEMTIFVEHATRLGSPRLAHGKATG